MSDAQPGPFEEKLARLEAIVKELEESSVGLDRAVTLFKEGKALASECEALLKDAQMHVTTAMGDTPSA
ncbi:MAG: exodeoxyribonuclease VII small subunit [Candidatus Baltobacteraceae bacterium]